MTLCFDRVVMHCALKRCMNRLVLYFKAF